MANSEIETSTNNTLGGEYQVFLSFRGLDTRRGFTSSLYHGLVDAGIRVFVDDEELRVGEIISKNLLQAIDNSELYIPIFSKNYASSHWCLRELAKMVENTSKSKVDGNKVILPIFYDVKPDDVKLKTTLYSEAILNLEQKMEDRKKFSCEDVETWRQALKKVDGTKGWELEKYPGYGDLINLVVSEVVARLKTRQRQVPKNLVGMEYQIAAIDKLLDINSDGVRLIGIYGMGGVGKTTLAKFIFNEHCPHFKTGCSFLDDVRETAKAKGLVKLQKKLLSDISHSRGAQNIGNIDDGINMIGQTICKRKMLIVLDDVDVGSQIQKLIGENSLYPGTRILVTTRDKSIMNIRGFKFMDYEMKRLSNKDALQLFSRHAFNDYSPPQKYHTLSESIASTTDGLPLALEAIGLSLFGQKKEKIWEERLEKLRKSPYKDVFEKLRISYEALESDQQQIFLDVACFIVGKKKTKPMYMWEDSEFGPEDAIDVLTNRCMVKVLDNDRFGMHDQFRDLGRAIAKQENTRLWDRNDIICQLSSIKIKESVQALYLPSRDLNECPVTVTSAQIKRFPHIRFLWLYDVIFQGDFTGCLSQLKWISLQNPPHPDAYHRCFEATNLLHLENVVVVNLSWLDFLEDEFENLIKVGKKLKVLTLERNRSICGTPTFPEYSVLEKLTIFECPFLMEIDCSIGKLRCLTELNIESCSALKKLPKQIGELQKLQQLSIWNCPSLSELPDSVLKLAHMYQVFLSCRGLDTYRAFTSSLYHALVDAGIRVFINDEELRPGERISGDLQQVIDDSKLYIPIFCKNYASTHQCLCELTKMVENTSKSKENGKQKVILPIFYDVKPNDVKLKTALYSEAILNLVQNREDQKKKFSSKDVETWRQALREVDSTKGWELEKYPSHRDLIKSVVEEVLVRLETRQRRVPKHLVRTEDCRIVMEVLDMDHYKSRPLGICGMGGIGKTTLAKSIFNQLCPRFGRNCIFLDDIRKTAKTKGLVKLQNQLLSDISHSNEVRYVGNIDHGINMIEKTICNKKMLVVLDDVDEAYQIKYLIGNTYLHPGTIILITTRNENVLNLRKFKHFIFLYEMIRLRDKEALELFSSCAFGDNSPPTNYYTLSKSIVSTADGLPLALTAIGSSLFGKKKRKIWEEMLDMLKKKPHKDVLAKLRISYDALQLDEKQIFLDFACFFIGEDASGPICMWQDCGFFPFNAISVLQRRYMIEFLDNHIYGMHDQLRDLGRDIAKQEHTRLWDKDDVICQLRSTEIKKSVQALRLSSGDLFQCTITANQIERFPHLRILWLTNVICQGDFAACLSELKWISLQYSPFYHQRLEATNLLRLQNAVVVNLSGLDITEDVFESLMKGATKLEILTLCYNTSIYRTPIFPQHSVLKKLTISNFLSLMEIDCSIGKMRCLTDLRFESCVQLEKLPEQIGELRNLNYLSLRSCDSLSELPDSILKLEWLTKLDVSCTRITRLPDSIGRLSRLLSIDVSFTPIEKLPCTMSKLPRLNTLHLNHCDWIQQLPKLPIYLTTLRLTSTSLLTIPNLSCLSCLVELALSDGSESMAKSDIIRTCDLQWIGSLSRLRVLQFCFSNVYAPTTEFGSLTLLDELTLHGLDVPTFEQVPSSLRVLELYDTRGKQVQLPSSEKETAIVSSSLSESEENKALQQSELEFIESHGLLEGWVHLRGEPGCNELEALELIDHWRGAFHFPSSFYMLRKFVLWGCPEVQDIQFVSTLESLSVFSVGGCASLKRLGGLSNLKNLMDLTLNQCWSLQVVEGIDELEFLHQLKIEGCRSVEMILDASSSKIPNKCSILITCSGELPDCGQIYVTWESYRGKILSRTKQASGSEIEIMDFEIETEDPPPKTNQENKGNGRKRKTDLAKQEERRKRRKIQKKAWVRLFHPIISLSRTRKIKRRKERARQPAKEQEKRKREKRALGGF